MIANSEWARICDLFDGTVPEHLDS